MNEKVQTIGVLGGGVMGMGIAMACAQSGVNVVLRDIDRAALDHAREAMSQGRFGWDRAIEQGRLTPEAVRAEKERLTFTTDLDALSAAYLVIEAIPEDEEQKKRAFQDLDVLLDPGAIIATNTSGFAIANLAQAVRRRDRFLGMHWFSPANVMSLVEIVYTPETREDVLATVEGLCGRLGKTAVRVKDAPGTYGFVANRVYYAALAEARRIAEAGIATEADIDLAMRLGYNWPAGPFETLHGRNTGWEV